MYSIGDVAKRMNVSASTLRYYDKEGLLPFVERTKSGIRQFKESDMDWLNIIECLKATGMPIKDIKRFIDWCKEGDSSIQQRYEMFLERRKETEAQIQKLQETLDVIDYKCWYYKTALDAGTEKVHETLAPEERRELPYLSPDPLKKEAS